MNTEYEKKIYLLPIARPKDSKSFLDWRPFSQDKLGEIIEKCNKKCIDFFKGCKWLSDDIKKAVPIISVFSYDPLKLDTVEKESFEHISIMLFDLDTFNINKEDVQDEINILRSRMGSLKNYQILQFGRNQGDVSQINLFPRLPVVPRVLRKQLDIEEFLDYFCKMNVGSARGVEEARKKFDNIPYDSKNKPMWDKLDISKIINETRDVAMLRGLSESSNKSLESLAYNMIINEHAISKIKEGQINISNMGKKAIMDPIRQIDKIPVVSSPETPELKPFNLLNVSLKQAPNDLTNEQCRIVKDLGFKEKDSFAIFFDEPNIRKSIDDLKGAVRISRFSADLPDWNK